MKNSKNIKKQDAESIFLDFQKILDLIKQQEELEREMKEKKIFSDRIKSALKGKEMVFETNCSLYEFAE